eukprot:TRINITY_DN13444_c0_g1_i2.p2 TRINITY_DN13444_c0_g1~~TRINITY_DN13444_c0_g1_i2.p2  ORF type:complete len:251 (-),score=40.73 TRINITY_DN13444_c0_g1_i2:119-871(-)
MRAHDIDSAHSSEHFAVAGHANLASRHAFDWQSIRSSPAPPVISTLSHALYEQEFTHVEVGLAGHAHFAPTHAPLAEQDTIMAAPCDALCCDTTIPWQELTPVHCTIHLRAAFSGQVTRRFLHAFVCWHFTVQSASFGQTTFMPVQDSVFVPHSTSHFWSTAQPTLHPEQTPVLSQTIFPSLAAGNVTLFVLSQLSVETDTAPPATSRAAKTSTCTAWRLIADGESQRMCCETSQPTPLPLRGGGGSDML